MADIDKSLPNVEQEIKIPSPEEIEVAQQEEQSKELLKGDQKKLQKTKMDL